MNIMAAFDNGTQNLLTNHVAAQTNILNILKLWNLWPSE